MLSARLASAPEMLLPWARLAWLTGLALVQAVGSQLVVDAGMEAAPETTRGVPPAVAPEVGVADAALTVGVASRPAARGCIATRGDEAALGGWLRQPLGASHTVCSCRRELPKRACAPCANSAGIAGESSCARQDVSAALHPARWPPRPKEPGIGAPEASGRATPPDSGPTQAP